MKYTFARPRRSAMQLRRAMFVVFIVAWITATGSGSAAELKKPWEWTTAERAAARRDPAKRLERVRASLAGKTARVGTRPPFDVIGGTHPELFFVTELFERLVRWSFVMLPDNYPHVVAQRSSDLFAGDPTEWSRFAAIVHDYTEVLRQESDAANTLDKKRVTALQEAKCVAAAHALREARRAFGRQRFDRMLYETVTFERSFGWDTDVEKSIGAALAREEHCQ